MTTRQNKALAALLTYKTRQQAADAAGINVCTLRDWLNNNKEFQDAYQKEVDELLRDAAVQAKKQLSDAVNVIAEVMRTGSNDQARLNAARYMVDYGLRLHEAVEIEKRIAEIEKRLEMVET